MACSIGSNEVFDEVKILIFFFSFDSSPLCLYFFFLIGRAEETSRQCYCLGG